MTEREAFEQDTGLSWDHTDNLTARTQWTRAWQASRKQALEEAAQVADRTSNSGRLMLTAGEMTAGELRTAKAILSYVGRAIRSLTTPTGEKS